MAFTLQADATDDGVCPTHQQGIDPRKAVAFKTAATYSVNTPLRISPSLFRSRFEAPNGSDRTLNRPLSTAADSEH